MEELQSEEIIKLKTISEFLFCDIYHYWASYPRFELCFQPLFNNIKINLFKVFIEIVGELKKYITYNRLLDAYLKYKKEKEKQKVLNSDLYVFFENLFTKILKEDNCYIGKHEDYSKNSNINTLSFSTKKGSKSKSDIKKSYMSKLNILNDKKGNIRGIMIEYDDIKKYELYPKEIKNKLNKGLELNLDIINKNAFLKHKKHYENIDISLYRDSITHIFGTINNQNIISFLGFKCISGKIKYVGNPDGDSFLFGEFGKKFHNLKLELNGEGITLFEPHFIENKRKNFYLSNKKEIENEDIIMDEDYLKDLKGDENKINQFIKTSFLEDDFFTKNDDVDDKKTFNEKNKDLFKKEYKKEDINPKELNHSSIVSEKCQQDIHLNKENSESEYTCKINTETKPLIFLKNKNFKDLKEKLAKSIYKQFYKQYNYNSEIPFNILNKLVPDEISEREANNKEEEMIEKIKFIKINGETIKISNKYESDDDKDNENNHIEEEDIKNNLINSDANELWKDIGYDFFEMLGLDKKYHKMKKDYLKNKNTPEENWINMSKRLERKYGVNLFQTIKSIIIALNAINKENIDDIKLKDKIKYYKLLSNKGNEKIIKFLSKNDKEENDNEKILLDTKTKVSNSLEKEGKDELREINDEKRINNIIQEKNNFIEKITSIAKEDLEKNNKFKSFLFSYQRKRTAMEEEDESNISLILKESEKNPEREKSSKNIVLTKTTTFHGQYSLDEELDPKFIPNRSSLCPLQEDNKSWDMPKKVLSSDIYQWELIKWRKIENIKMFMGGSPPDIDSIRQGEYIGDCYFLSALGSLCDIKNYLQSLINVIKRSPNKKIYAVKFNINGEWKYVLIDNYLPYIPDDNGNDNFCFASSFKKELWVSLFEKAWAKINGCYAQIGCGGNCSDAFDILTAAYTQIIRITNINDEVKEKLWKKLKKEKNRNYVICAGTRRLGIFENVGLVSNHAYTIINIYEINYENKILRLVKLRNPWGEKEFNGDWSDKSSKWTDELKKKVDFEGVKDDGIFYMSYEDFIEYYSLIEILKHKQGYGIIASCKIKKTDNHKCQIIKFEVKENKKNIFINLYQKNPRIIRKNGTYFPDPVKSFIILAKIEEDGKYTYIKSKTDTKVHLGIEANLDKGKYLIFCDVNYRFVYYEIYGYNITIYSNNPKEEFILENITNNYNGKQRAEILNQVIYDYFLKNKNNDKKIIKVENYKDVVFYKSTKFNEDFPFIILILINDSEKKGIYFSCKVKYDKRKNVCIYNDSDVSEFDNFAYKEIKDKYNIVLIMGYEISDKFFIQPKLSDKKENFKHFIFNYDSSSEDDNFKFYISFTARKRGYIFGLEKKNDKKIENIKFIVEGMNIVDPLYNTNNDKVIFSMSKKGEKKVFNLRLKPDCEIFDYHIEY